MRRVAPSTEEGRSRGDLSEKEAHGTTLWVHMYTFMLQLLVPYRVTRVQVYCYPP